jgi:peptidoglycan/xylan/chitin deacetylase (PgdA/CDA1 family)
MEQQVAPGVPEDGGELFQTGNLIGKSFGLAKNDVVLTFDDGPAAGLSLELGRYLANKGVKAHWFINYENASDLDNSSAQTMIRELCSLGHQVGNHNFGHTYNTNTWSKLKDVDAKIKALCPRQDIVYYRAPGGGWRGSDAAPLNNATDAQGNKVGLRYIGPVFWDVACDTEQSPAGCKSSNAQTLANSYYDLIVRANNSRTGVIVLGHDVPWHKATVNAFMQTNLIDRLKNAGFRFVTLDKNSATTSQLLGRSVSGGSSGGSTTTALIGKAKATSTTLLKKVPIDSSDSRLTDNLKCTLEAGKTIGFSQVTDSGNYLKLTVDIRSNGCPEAFWTTPNKDVYIFQPHFTIMPRECVINGNGDDYTNVRASTSLGSPDNIVGRLNPGSKVVPENVSGDFFQIVFEGRPAFVHKGQFNAPCNSFPF